MEHEAHVGLVDAHAERDGRDHDHAWLGHEAVLVKIAVRLLHAGVVGQGVEAGIDQGLGGLLGLLARETVDDAGGPLVALQEAEQLAPGLPFQLDREANVGPVEAHHQGFGLAVEELLQDVLAGDLIGGRGQCRDRHAGKERRQAAQVTVFRPERRAPLGDAVGLVDRDQPHLQLGERGQHALGHQPLGRHVEDPGLAPRGPAPGGDVLVPAALGVDRVGRDPGQAQGGDLVVHQGDQGRDHHGQPAQNQRRHLEAERLARAGRHDREHVAACQERVDRRLLAGPKGLEAEDLLEHLVLGVAVLRWDRHDALSWRKRPGAILHHGADKTNHWGGFPSSF